MVFQLPNDNIRRRPNVRQGTMRAFKLAADITLIHRTQITRNGQGLEPIDVDDASTDIGPLVTGAGKFFFKLAKVKANIFPGVVTILKPDQQIRRKLPEEGPAR